MTSRLRIVVLSLWTASAVTTTAQAQGGAGIATTPDPFTREPVRTVEAVDLNRYAGEWFEVARFPNRFQRQCVSDVRASYTQRPDGRLDVINRCRTEDGSITEARGVARVTDDRTFAQLKVRFAPAALSFLPFVWGDYWILGLASDYSWATVGSPDRTYLWILARTPSLPAESLASALAAARANGFDVERLTKTTHTGAGPGDSGVGSFAPRPVIAPTIPSSSRHGFGRRLSPLVPFVTARPDRTAASSFRWRRRTAP